VNRYSQLDKDMVGEIWTSTEASDNLANLTGFGSRFGGTESERLAVDYMVQKFEEYGMDSAAKEHFNHLGWTRGTAALSSVEPVEKEFDCISLPHVGTAEVTGELLYVGSGTPHEFDAVREELEGKLVMLSSKSPSYYYRSIHRKEKLGRAVEGGAKAVVFMRWEPGLLPETGSTTHDREYPIPVVSVSREVGEELRRLGDDEPPVLQLAVENTLTPNADSWNVVGELTGRKHPDELVIVGAHFDGHDIAQGAMDDGAGAAVVMESARALARHKEQLDRTVRFVCFALEEVGLQGSFNYVKQHEEELDNIRFMLNLDGAGRGDERKDLALQGFTELIPYLRRVTSEINEWGIVDNNMVLFTDCFPFLTRGVPSGTARNLRSSSTVRGFAHTPADTLDKVSLRDLQTSAIRVARLILRVANADDWPAQHKTESEVKEAIGPAGLEVLRLANRYPFEE
jgi:Zn-dependent M28 family amino/carboxypeptidase